MRNECRTRHVSLMKEPWIPLTHHSSLTTYHFTARPLVRAALLVWCGLTLNARLLAAPIFAYDEAVDSVMYQDPDPPRPGRVKVFP